MRRILPFIYLLVMLCLNGCIHFRGMPSLQMLLPERFKEQPVQPVPLTLQKAWWKHTDDAMLTSLITQIEKENLSLEQARFRLMAAREETRVRSFLPTFTAGIDGNYAKTLSGESTSMTLDAQNVASSQKLTGYYNARLDSQWEIPLYGQVGSALRLAKAEVAFAEADIASVRASVVSEAVRLYTDMRRLQQEQSEREKIAASYEKIVNYQSIKYKAGLITETELFASQKAQLSAQAELQHTLSDLTATEHQLAKLLGKMTPDSAWKTVRPLPRFTAPNFHTTPLDVLRNRPDIRKSEASVLAASEEFSLAKSELYPKLTLSGTLSELGNLTGTPLAGNSVQLSGIPSLSVPLFDWGERLSQAKTQDAKLSETASAYRETVIAAMHEVETFFASYRTASSSEDMAKNQATLETARSSHTALLFTQGLASGIEAENAAIAAAQASITYATSRADTVASLAALTKALGGMTEPHDPYTKEKNP